MKKLLVIFLSLLLVLLPFSVTAKPSPPNYLEGLTWEKGYSSTITQVNGLEVTATNITKTYSSPALNITSAVQQCFLDNNLAYKITIRISGMIKLDFVDPAANISSLRFVIRSRTTISNPNIWQTKYENSLYGDAPFFSIEGKNVYTPISLTYSVRNTWTPILLDVDITFMNAFCDLTPNWLFCVDNIRQDKPVKNMHFKDMKLEILSVSSSKNPQNPTAKPAATPTLAIPPRVTPSRTLAPYSTPVLPTAAPVNPTVKPTRAPGNDEELKKEFYDQPLINDINNIISASVKGVILIIILAGFFAIILNLFKKHKK